MRRLLVAFIATGSAVAFTQFALAADLPVKAPRYAPPTLAPVYSWTGFYIGGNVGYSWGNADSNINVAPSTGTASGLPSAFTVPGFAGSDSVKPKGVIGGAQIGYNWQLSPNWVAGLEADWQGSGEKASHTLSDPIVFILGPPNPGLPVIGTIVTNYEAKISWFGTVRGRLGYAWDRVMLYATGGLAYGEVKIGGTTTVSGIINGFIPFSAVANLSDSKINAGWTVGAGIEAALTNNWSWKAEYLYIDLGSLDDPPPISPAAVTVGAVTTHTHFTDNIVRVGLNYKFN